MYRYRILVQFAAADAPGFEEIEPVIEKAVENYNQKSLIAKNPKQILRAKILNPRTLEIMLESRAELPYPSKALRLFSAYMVDPNTDGNLVRCISGKQLFKMTAEETPVQHSEETDPADLVKKFVQILYNKHTDVAMLKKIEKILQEWEREGHV